MNTTTANKRLLVVDDDPEILKIIATRLESKGFQVVAASDGEEALQQVLEDPAFDLVLLDIRMPRMDGFQVCHRLKEDSSTAGIPIILFTGEVDRWQGLTEECIRLGVEGWLRKPFNTKELLERIYQVLGKRKRSDA